MGVLCVVDVIEVTRAQRVEVKEMNGVSRFVLKVNIQVEGGSFYLPVRDGVEVPLHWSGRAYCTARTSNFIRQFRDNSNTNFCFLPDEIQAFEKKSEVKPVDILSSFGIRPAGQGGNK